jgi:hypothetical protein
MCAYQEPEVYVKGFVGFALSGIESVQSFFEGVPHIRLKADYGISLSRRLVGALRIGSK